MVIKFHVSGVPRPKGSMRAFIPKGWTRPVLTNSSTAVKTWEQAIRSVAQDHAAAFTTDPVRVRLSFAMPRPKSLSRLASRRPHTKRPDVDKLARAALDALTGVIFKDDSQVFSLHAVKRYALEEEAPHVNIMISTRHK
jgi:crossover junction endodeoxyribonuclease RusA